MTIATTATVNLDVDTLVRLAYSLDGFGPHEPSAGDLLLGRQVLGLGLQSLANDGIICRANTLVPLTLTAGVAYVDAPADTLAVERGGAIRNTSGNDIAITPMAIEQYNAMPVKTTQGMPSRYFPNQSPDGTWRIYFWPVPSAEFPTFVVPLTRRSRDVSLGNVTLDFDPKWHLAIVTFLQAKLAVAKGRKDLGAQLMNEYREERERAKNNETDRGDVMFIAEDIEVC